MSEFLERLDARPERISPLAVAKADLMLKSKEGGSFAVVVGNQDVPETVLASIEDRRSRMPASLAQSLGCSKDVPAEEAKFLLDLLQEGLPERPISLRTLKRYVPYQENSHFQFFLNEPLFREALKQQQFSSLEELKGELSAECLMAFDALSEDLQMEILQAQSRTRDAVRPSELSRDEKEASLSTALDTFLSPSIVGPSRFEQPGAYREMLDFLWQARSNPSQERTRFSQVEIQRLQEAYQRAKERLDQTRSMMQLLIQRRDVQRGLEASPKEEKYLFRKNLEKIEGSIKEFLQRYPNFSEFLNPESLNGERVKTQAACNKASETFEVFSRMEDQVLHRIAEILRFFEPDAFCSLFLRHFERRFSLTRAKDGSEQLSRAEKEAFAWMAEHQMETFIERLSQAEEKRRYVDRFWDLVRVDSLGEDAVEILEFLRAIFSGRSKGRNFSLFTK